LTENVSVNQDWLNTNLPADFQSLLQARDRDELLGLIGACVQAMGFGGFLFSRWMPDPDRPGAFLYSTMSNFPAG
jgi:hypothetical protein